MLFILMGVSGCGKTTVGELLAQHIAEPFYDADDFHSAANIEKMSHNIPLNDEDRSGWLATLATDLGKWEKVGGAILACSALKESYRTTLQAGAQEPIHWVWLDGPRELLLERMGSRKGHYMHPEMLDSQLATLEKPAYALRLSITHTPAELVSAIEEAIKTDPGFGTQPVVSP